MEKRINIHDLEPQAFKAMYGLEGYLKASAIDKKDLTLIKLRASQINSCSFCIDMHTKDALAMGETQQRLFILSAWRETDLFTEKEKALIALTEEVTMINQHGVSGVVYANVEKFFNANEIAQLIVAIATINAWNRIAISSKMEIPK